MINYNYGYQATLIESNGDESSGYISTISKLLCSYIYLIKQIYQFA